MFFCPVQWSPGHENFFRPPPPRRKYDQEEEDDDDDDDAPRQNATTCPAATNAAAPSTPPGSRRESGFVVTTKNTTTTTTPARRTVSGTPPPSLARTCEAPSSSISPFSLDSPHPPRDYHHQKTAAPSGPAVAATTPATVEAMTPSPAGAARTLSPSAPVPRTTLASGRADDDAGVGPRSVSSLRPRTLHFESEPTHGRPHAEEHEHEQEQVILQSSSLSWTMAMVVLFGLSCSGYLLLSSSSSSIAFNRLLFHRDTSSNRRHSNRITPQPMHNEEGSTTTNNGHMNMEVVVTPIQTIVPPIIVTAFDEETTTPQHNDHSHTAEERVRAIHNKQKDNIDHHIEEKKTTTNNHRLKLIPIETTKQRRDTTSVTAAATATTKATVSVVSTTTRPSTPVPSRILRTSAKMKQKQTAEESRCGTPVLTVGDNKRSNVDKNRTNNHNNNKSKNRTNRKGSVTTSKQQNSVMTAPAPATPAFTSSRFLPPPPKPKGLAATTTRVVPVTSSSRWSSLWSSLPTIEDPGSGARDHSEVVRGDGRPVVVKKTVTATTTTTNLPFFPGLARLINQYVAPFVRGTYVRFSRVVTQHRAYRSRERYAFQQHLLELQQLHQDVGPHPRWPRRRRRHS